MRPKAESSTTSEKSRPNNLIVLVKFSLKLAKLAVNANNDFQLFSTHYLTSRFHVQNRSYWIVHVKIAVVYARAPGFSIISRF